MNKTGLKYLIVFILLLINMCTKEAEDIPQKVFITIPLDSVINNETATKWYNCNKELDNLGIKYASLTLTTDSVKPNIKELEKEYSAKQKEICKKYDFKSYEQFKTIGLLLLNPKNKSIAKKIGISLPETKNDSLKVKTTKNIKH